MVHVSVLKGIDRYMQQQQVVFGLIGEIFVSILPLGTPSLTVFLRQLVVFWRLYRLAYVVTISNGALHVRGVDQYLAQQH